MMSTPVTSGMVSGAALENIFGPMVESMTVNGSTIICTEREPLFSLTRGNMLVSIRMMLKRDLAPSPGRTGMCIKGIGGVTSGEFF
jgi:hypothetical protein